MAPKMATDAVHANLAADSNFVVHVVTLIINTCNDQQQTGSGHVYMAHPLCILKH